MRLYTSRWANKELAELTCQPVGISRGRPRFGTGYKYRLTRELAPGDRAWAEEDVGAFAAAYVEQLEEIGLDAILGRLARISEEAGGLPLVLLCFEDLSKPGEWCHRRHLSAWFGEHGLEVPELEAGMLGKRPNASQQALFDCEEDRA